ncbi:type II toxin-antitoxin system RelE/ParE family toxin [Taklimakanibacter albus]|uniref:Type II toxin-antitoxin system RelE/ParE family toxin n=1 Tax=Taklimakanibacter albus TaxID=2800327 RepID=A0ACC5QWP9_9HYPH|nr:type II toxin-antitoxin system RelE/ParE family toxin [Aestuariivirga sp. YIM B02566]MBK1864793.1 type II toxin-antitoxin system RelE/ParE family toxin [Aestuariivirga sp. YIM B02566]
MARHVNTEAFDNWLSNLKDRKASARIVARLIKFESTGHAGDTKPVGNGVMEMRFDLGPGYRVYYIVLKDTVILLGGDKSTQTADIAKAKKFAIYWKDRLE